MGPLEPFERVDLVTVVALVPVVDSFDTPPSPEAASSPVATDATRAPLFPTEQTDGEPLDDEAFFASLREAVSDQAPLGPRDDATAPDVVQNETTRTSAPASSAGAARPGSGRSDPLDLHLDGHAVHGDRP